MMLTSRVLATAAGVAMLLTGCGDDTIPPAAPATTEAPSATPAPTNEPDGVGGVGSPAATEGEFDLTSTFAIVGTADVDPGGCWWLDGDGDRGLLVAPPGTELGETGDTLVIDGAVIADGAHVEIEGVVLYSVDELPGGTDGRWGTYLAYCAPTGRMVVVAKTLTIPDEPAVDVAAGELADLGAALFDTDHGCGYGFATGSADQRWALRLWVNQSDTIESGTITLPDDRFTAVVDTGRRLFANYCDDVDEWFEPDPVIAATWPIVAGSFDYPGSDGTGDCTQGAVTTTLTDAVVDVGGTTISLGPITIENRSFGCFAG